MKRKGTRISFYMDEEKKAAFQDYCKEKTYTMSDFLKAAIEQREKTDEILAKLEEVAQVKKDFYRALGSLHRLEGLCKKEGEQISTKEIRKGLEALKKEMEELCRY